MIVRVDYIRYVLFAGATLPCAVRCMQADCTNLEGMAILTATLPPSYTGHGVAFSILLSLCCLQLYGLYRGAEGETVKLTSLMEAIGGSEDALPAEQFIRLVVIGPYHVQNFSNLLYSAPPPPLQPAGKGLLTSREGDIVPSGGR